MTDDGKRMVNGVEACAPARGFRGARFLASALVLTALAAILVAAASTAWAQPIGANFVADVRLEVESQLETLHSLASSGDGSSRLRTSQELDVSAVQQYPELPSGCESVALANLLGFYGFDVGKTEIADDWLATSDDDFVHAFLGDPRDVDGGTCMVPALADAANAYLAAQGSNLRAMATTGESFSQVIASVSAGDPVIVWCTVDLEEPSESYVSAYVDDLEYRFVQPSHCVVVSGYDMEAGLVYASDSLAGKVSYPLDVFAERYYQLGAQALTLAPA